MEVGIPERKMKRKEQTCLRERPMPEYILQNGSDENKMGGKKEKRKRKKQLVFKK
uniref:Uncharacterized protein n=1 Tax=Octopus bimaculoides TaxID=37653 RepID=A0A0L8HSY4_OCTBM